MKKNNVLLFLMIFSSLTGFLCSMDRTKQKDSFLLPIDRVFLNACKNDKPIDYFIRAEDFNINITEPNGYTGLHYACEYSDLSKVKLLLDEGIKINAETISGQTPLHIAVIHKNLEIVELLLQRGAICKSDMSGGTPLDYARSNKLFKIASVLDLQFFLNNGFIALCRDCKDKDIFHEAMIFLEKGAHINAVDDSFFGYTALHYACWQNNTNLIELLLERGADINAVATDGTTILHCAAMSCSENIIIRLLEKGALYRTNHSGKNPIDYAPANIKNILQKIHNDQEEMDGYLFAACKNGQLLRKLFGDATKINVNAIDTKNQNWTPLHYACDQTRLENMIWLLMGGAGVNSKSEILRITPSHIAAIRGDMFGLTLLKAKKADINLADSRNRPPLYYAVAGLENELRLITVQSLLDMGADPNIADKDGKRLLDIMYEQYKKNRDLSSVAVVGLLVEAGARLSNDENLQEFSNLIAQHPMPQNIEEKTLPFSLQKKTKNKKSAKTKKNMPKKEKNSQKKKIAEVIHKKETILETPSLSILPDNVSAIETESVIKKETEKEIISPKKIEEPKKEKKSLTSTALKAVQKQVTRIVTPEKTFAAAIGISSAKEKSHKDDTEKTKIKFRDSDERQIILYPQSTKLNGQEYSIQEIKYTDHAQSKRSNLKDLCHSYPSGVDQSVLNYGECKKIKDGELFFTMPGKRELLGNGLRSGMFEVAYDIKKQEIKHSFFRKDKKDKAKVCNKKILSLSTPLLEDNK